MATKKTAKQRARHSPARDPEEDESDLGDNEDFNPRLTREVQK